MIKSNLKWSRAEQSDLELIMNSYLTIVCVTLINNFNVNN